MKEQTLKVSISGMTCDGCARTVANQFEDKKGVLDKTVSYPDEQAEITYDPEQITKEELIDTINATGHYKVTGEIGDQDNGRSRYSLVIIGGGSTAFAAAIKASELGGTALIINKGLPTGGTCVNVGCVPSKTLIRAAEAHHRAKNPGFEGIETQSRITDFKKIIDQKREMVQDLRQQKYIDVIKDDPSITLLEERGTLVDEHTVEAGGETYHADNILIATGASTFVPDVPGLEETGYLTNETAYELKELPEHLIVLGGGYIALENAQLFARLGSKVTIVQRSEHVLSDQPKELAQALTGYLEAEGIAVLTNTELQQVQSDGDGKVVSLTVDGKETTLKATHLLVATGRRGNTKDLGLKNVGLATKGRGYLPVDKTMRTSVPNIFAAGDVTGKHQYVYTAAYEGNLAAENAFRSSSRKADYSVLPWVIFTNPQVAGIGMDELQAREAGIDYDTAKLTLDNVPRSIAARDTRGFIKLIRNRENDRLVGARILAPEGSELLMELALAMRHGVTVQSLKSEFYPYLTLSEGIKLAALTFDKDVKKLSCCAV
ncbi:mercury(II) reductase [Aliifodinibius sp. S!AR15-10]|uniref:mercury(II) reductase n=1 Tax=Aliifodinibius sp. S!AR15-10 TaxID=2950437 RepID=UPI00286743E6|nr:mercury(II) reductase [Aliifodinibius sp. S!AR15-10]MDR8390497.1 mercury(II) reductase [Aliifodinibius sp. S!AR15-10]